MISQRKDLPYDRDGEVVRRFGFHNLGWNSLATFLMDEQENPAVVQAVMRHANMDITLSTTLILVAKPGEPRRRRFCNARFLQRPLPEEMRVPMPELETIQ